MIFHLRMWNFISSLVILIFLWSVQANECTSQCDADHPSGHAVTFCGLDGMTYKTTFDAYSVDDGAM
jgi:hypothetical protein